MRYVASRVAPTCVFLAILGLAGVPSALARVDLEGILAAWSFDEGEGEAVFDVTGRGNDGVLVGNVEWVDGRFGSALSFDGLAALVEIDDPVNIPEESLAYTVSAWVNPDKSQKAYANILGNHHEDAGAGHGYVVQQQNKETNRYYVAHGADGTWKVPAGVETQLEHSSWQHFVVVRDGDTYTMFLDGEATASGGGVGNAPVTPAAAVNMVIGEWGWGGWRAFKGMIDDVLIAARALTEDEIRDLGTGIKSALSVAPHDRLATTWAQLKSGSTK